ncbi:Vesicular GABA transporter [Choanephora cucurbitarum]|uniref:Vesicular GABA transporter n=1 Tax=Choanephora cucurbitarum TaxID=101091 RepID=A0A1C7N8Y4_9FUNG|nr:Vesicular GABA transporter [Choanephora cucurbitarum]
MESVLKSNDQTKGNISNTSTLSNIICVVAGTGILAIAHALSKAGWIGLLFLILGALMSHFTGIILIQCLYAHKHQRFQDYADLGYAAFGRPGQVIGWLFSQLFLFLTPTIYMILASENMSEIFMVHYGIPWLDRHMCIWILSAVVGIPFMLVRNLRDVSFLSTFACMATFCLLLIVCVASLSNIRDMTGVHHKIAIAKNIPLAFSTFSFSYCGHVFYPHLEVSMKTPSRWPKVLLVSTCVIGLMYLVMGFTCYLVYGQAVVSPIYRSLPRGASQLMAMLVITLHVLLAIPLYLYAFTLSIESWFYRPSDGNKKMQIMVRMIEMMVCCLLAMFIPYFSDFMVLVGSVFSDTLSFILPSIFWIKLNWHTLSDMRHGYLKLCACLVIASIGIICAIFGTMDAANTLVYDFKRII